MYVCMRADREIKQADNADVQRRRIRDESRQKRNLLTICEMWVGVSVSVSVGVGMHALYSATGCV